MEPRPGLLIFSQPSGTCAQDTPTKDTIISTNNAITNLLDLFMISPSLLLKDTQTIMFAEKKNSSNLTRRVFPGLTKKMEPEEPDSICLSREIVKISS